MAEFKQALGNTEENPAPVETPQPAVDTTREEQERSSEYEERCRIARECGIFS